MKSELDKKLYDKPKEAICQTLRPQTVKELQTFVERTK